MPELAVASSDATALQQMNKRPFWGNAWRTLSGRLWVVAQPGSADWDMTGQQGLQPIRLPGKVMLLDGSLTSSWHNGLD
jgi:hypothetical protein